MTCESGTKLLFLSSVRYSARRPERVALISDPSQCCAGGPERLSGLLDQLHGVPLPGYSCSLLASGFPAFSKHFFPPCKSLLPIMLLASLSRKNEPTLQRTPPFQEAIYLMSRSPPNQSPFVTPDMSAIVPFPYPFFSSQTTWHEGAAMCTPAAQKSQSLEPMPGSPPPS